MTIREKIEARNAERRNTDGLNRALWRMSGINPSGICDWDCNSSDDREAEMTTEERIAQLEAKLADIEDQLNMAYDDLDRRLNEAVSERSYRLAVVGVVISAVIGSNPDSNCAGEIARLKAGE